VTCNRRASVDIHVATPYGVSGHLLVPVMTGGDHARDTAPAFESACAIEMTFVAVKVTGSTAIQARVDEFFATDCDAISIRVPRSFIPPSKASLSMVLRDTASGETAATFSFADPFFDGRGHRYLVAGGDLRNLVGDTSRPATDKTLRGAVKPYLDTLLLRGELADDGDDVPLTVTAEVVAGEQAVPVGGELAVRVVRRGPTTAEPAAVTP
jgi:hypothetical protein